MTKSTKILRQLEEYFNTTPKEVLDKEWAEVQELNNIGPTVDEYLEAHYATYMNAYLVHRFLRNNHPKYAKYCKQWVENVTKEQLDYFYIEARHLNFILS